MSLFSKQFTVTEVDKNGKQFDDISRIEAQDTDNVSHLVLDYHCKIYSLKKGQSFHLNLYQSLPSSTGSKDGEHWHPSILDNNTMAGSYEYIMHGKVYNYEENQSTHKATVYVSFGGLLMSLDGDMSSINEIQRGKEVYLLIRRQ